MFECKWIIEPIIEPREHGTIGVFLMGFNILDTIFQRKPMQSTLRH